MFSDDIKLFQSISTPQDCILLQDNLKSLVTRAATHGLDLCINKCTFMAFYRSLNCPFSFNYSISGVLFESDFESINDLGITNDRCLKFNAHLDIIFCKAMKC